MTSPLYDVETTCDPTTKSRPKQSFLRKWGLALVAIAGVAAVNVSISGSPPQSKTPAFTERRLNTNNASDKPISAIGDMNFDAEADRNLGRSLTDGEGGLMEYTRPRHRKLGDYTFHDNSDKFTTFGKASVAVIYFAFWVFLMFPNWFLPIGRPGLALAGGLSMVVWRAILRYFDHGPVFDAEAVIIMEPLFLLFGLMLTTIYLEKMERGGIFDKLRNSLDHPVNWRRSFNIMLMSTIGSAAVMNDSVVLIFSGVVVDLCVRHKVTNSMPYLLSLATTANIGSALTMTGNPQNILIVSLAYDAISWLEFASNMVIPVVVATVINAVMMFTYYAKELFPGSSGYLENCAIMFLGRKTQQIEALENAYHVKKSSNSETDIPKGWTLWSKLQVLVTILFLVCFAAGLDVCVVSICAGIVLMVLASYKNQHYDKKLPDKTEFDANGNALPPKKLYDMDGNEIEPEEEELITESETTLTEVDYGLLLLFIGQFMLIGSFDDTGLPQSFFDWSMGSCREGPYDGYNLEGLCIYRFVSIITVLSNVASNVPVCQMLAATFPYASLYQWMQVSFSATIAGNLTMLGSAANMIVAFQAAKVGDRTFTSERHGPFGIPSTLLCLFVGTFLLKRFHFAPECSSYNCPDENANAVDDAYYYGAAADDGQQDDDYYQ